MIAPSVWADGLGDGIKMAQDGRQMAPNGLKNGLKMAPDGLNMASTRSQDRFKMAPNIATKTVDPRHHNVSM